MPVSRLLVAVVAAHALAACAPDDDVVEVGRLYNDDLGSIEAPATVARGQSFVVRVTTEGQGGMCVSLDSTDSDQTATTATMTPYDRRHTPGPHEGCILLTTQLVHEAAFAFDDPGTKRIDIHVQRPTATGDMPTIVPIDVVVE